MKLIKRILHRMVPSRFRNPDDVIGTCLYCGNQVAYAAGAADEQGVVRHDTCWKLVRAHATQTVLATHLLQETASILSGIPAIKVDIIAALDALPRDEKKPDDVLKFLSKALQIVHDEPRLSTDARRVLVGKLSGIRLRLLADICA